MTARQAEPSRAVEGGGVAGARSRPSDLRLVPAAAAAWLAAGWGVGVRPGTALTVAAAAVLVSLGVLLWSRPPLRLDSAAGPAGSGGTAGQIGLAALAVALVLVSVAGQAAVRTSGVLLDLVEQGATVRAETVVKADPRPVHRDPAEADDEARVVVRLAVRSVTGRGVTGAAHAQVLAIGDAGWSALRPGQVVTARGRLVPAEPGDDVLALLIPTAAPEVTGSASLLQRRAESLRAGLRGAADPLPADSRGLLPGLVVGDTSRLPPDLDEAMTAAGLTHLTAVSGSNVAIVCGTTLLVAAGCGAGRRTRLAATGLSLVGFVVLARPDPSVLRAAVMGAIGLLGLASARRARGMPALSAAVVGLTVVDPWLSRAFGFALSVLATSGLLLLARPWAEVLARVLPLPLAHAVAVPAAAQAVCAPVIILLNPQLSLVAVPANLLVTPAVAPATVLGVLATVVAPVWAAGAHALAWVAGLATWWISSVARVAAAVPGASVPWPGGVSGAILLGAATLAVLLLVPLMRRAAAASALLGVGGRRHRFLLAAVACSCVSAVLLLWPGSPVRIGPGSGWPPAGWRVVACDVGQGDALVLTTGPGSAVVVDTGPEPAPVDGCLRRLGVRIVDLLVVTHFHADHAGGVTGVVSRREVRQALVSPLAEPRDRADATRRVLAEAGVPVQVADAGQVGVAGPVAWRVLWPDAARVPATAGSGAGDGDGDGDGDGSAANDASVVLLLEQPGLRLLAAGDVEPAAQAPLRRALLASGVRLPVDVLKVAHHGSSRQDGPLHRLLSPRLAMVSVGEDNDYGHPAPATLGLLRDVGAMVARTDLLGDVAVGGDAGSGGGRKTLWVAGRDDRPTAPGASLSRDARSPPANPPLACRRAVAVSADGHRSKQGSELAGRGAGTRGAGDGPGGTARRAGDRTGCQPSPRPPPR